MRQDRVAQPQKTCLSPKNKKRLLLLSHTHNSRRRAPFVARLPLLSTHGAKRQTHTHTHTHTPTHAHIKHRGGAAEGTCLIIDGGRGARSRPLCVRGHRRVGLRQEESRRASERGNYSSAWGRRKQQRGAGPGQRVGGGRQESARYINYILYKLSLK